MLDKLKRRLGITGAEKDPLLNDLIADASAFVCSYTGRTDIPVLLEAAVVWLAAADYNQLGLEGEKSHSEGAVSHMIDMFPPRLRQQLNMYRVAKVGSP